MTPASIFKSVLLTFFSQEDHDWNMETTGVMIKCTRGEFHLRSTFGCLLGDVKGMQECLSLKVASGSHEFCTTVMSAVTQVARNQWWTQSSELLGLRTISMPWRSARLHLRSPIYRTLFSHAYYAYVRRRLGNILVTPPTDFCNTLVTFW